MFQTDDSWEEIRATQALRSVFNQPGLRRYTCVEVPNNVVLFHIDLCLLEEQAGDEMWHRYVVDDLTAALSLVSASDADSIRISLQTKLKYKETYEMHRVIEILECSLQLDRRAYICVCQSGERILCASQGITAAELGIQRSVWVASTSHFT